VRLHFGEFTVDVAGRQLLRGRQPLHVSPKAFDVLRVLLQRRPEAVSKSDLHTLVWRDTFVTDTSLTMVITEIRKLLGDDPHAPRFVRTVHRFGYAFCGVVEDVEPATPGGAGAGPRAWLVWNERTLVLKEGDNVVGRDPQCGVWLDVPGVSRRHARILLGSGAALLEDLGSKNGTFVGSAQIAAVTPIADGDVVQIGPVTTQFRMWSERKGTETERIPRRR
jgi:DNA-binding winged helix-turn-helix (wHTH) protein